MNIIITGTGFAFPDGTGSTSRVIAFAKGILSNGGLVNVFCPKPTENHSTGNRNMQLKGVYEGVPFEYTCGRRLIANTRIGALILYLKGLFGSFINILQIHRNQSVDAIILWYGELPLNFLFFFVLAKVIGAVLVLEKSEYPYVYSKKTLSVRIMIMFYEHITLKCVDGVIVISEFLKGYFEKHLGEKAKIFKMPIIVDTDRFFSDHQKNRFVNKKIIYCGNLDHHSEIIELLESFERISNDFPEWSLEVIGPISDLSVMSVFNSFIYNNSLEERVVFVGSVPRAEIPERLRDGDIMVLPRASGTFSNAGFPTKLGEYLATGKPVIVTDTGDICEYLKDKVSAYLVLPNDINAFAGVLSYVISNYAEAIEVGQNGRMVAMREFDSKIQGKRLLRFISEFSGSWNKI